MNTAIPTSRWSRRRAQLARSTKDDGCWIKAYRHLNQQRISVVKRICGCFALTFLFAANGMAQPPAPTVKITCTVNYEFVKNHVRDMGNAPKIAPQGDFFSGHDLFMSRQWIDLNPKKIVSSGRYKVTVDAAMHSFLSNACTENIGQVLSYIDTHDFDAMQNVFYLVEKSAQIPPGAVERKIGDWHLASWNNRTDRRVD